MIYKNIVKMPEGGVYLMFPRRFWQLWKTGWHKHETFFGRKCWIRYNWTEDDLKNLTPPPEPQDSPPEVNDGNS